MTDINKIKDELGVSIYWYSYEKQNWDSDNYSGLSFGEFLSLLDDFYLFEYSNAIKNSSWMVFNWLRLLTRPNGYAKVSYNDVVRIFCSNGKKMSSPTFFSAIDELIEKNMIVRLNTYKVFDGRFQNDDNVYAIVSKTEYVHKMCKLLSDDPSYASYDLYAKVADIEYEEVKSKPQPKSGSTGSKGKDLRKLKLLKAGTFSGISKTIDKFFAFLGSYNATGKISVSRQLDFLVTVKEEYLTIGFTLDDIKYAINKTIANTSKSNGKNYKRERYFYAILNAQCEYDEDDSENSVAMEMGKEAQNEIQSSYVSSYNSIGKDEYKEHLEKLTRVNGYHKQLLKEFDGASGEYEVKLVKFASLIDRKLEDINSYKKYSTKRIRYLLENGIAEMVEYDRKWNKVIEWVYDNNDKPVPLNVMKELINSNPDVFVFSKYEIFDGKDDILG